MKDKPVFGSASELSEAFAALRKASPAKRKDLPKLKDAVSLGDVFESLREARSKKASDRVVAKHTLLSDLIAGKQAGRRHIHIKIDPLLACLSDEAGRVHVRDRAYDILSEEGTQELMMMMPRPEPEPDPGGGSGPAPGPPPPPAYVFTEEPPEDWVQWLPCGPWTVLPGYPTHFFDANIGGRVVLVQLWKGSCPDYLGHGAGGVGAEVGLYNRDLWLPTTFWWPDHQHEKMIDFTLLNPVTTAPFFSAGSPGPIWWSHKWMKFPSYDQYVRDQQNRVPATTEQYVLRYRIDGTLFEW